MKHAYPALNLFIVANKALGVVVVLCGTGAGILILLGSIALSGALGMMGAGAGVLVIIASLLTGLGLVAAGEWIDLHITIEVKYPHARRARWR